MYFLWGLYLIILIGFSIAWARGKVEFMPDKPLTIRGYYVSMVLAFAAKGLAAAYALQQPWYYGICGGALSGVLFATPTILIVNAIHRRRRTRYNRSIGGSSIDWDA